MNLHGPEANGMLVTHALEVHRATLAQAAQRDYYSASLIERLERTEPPDKFQTYKRILMEGKSDWNIGVHGLHRARTLHLCQNIHRQLAPIAASFPEEGVVAAESLLWQDAGFVLSEIPFGHVNFLPQTPYVGKEMAFVQARRGDPLGPDHVPITGLLWHWTFYKFDDPAVAEIAERSPALALAGALGGFGPRPDRAALFIHGFGPSMEPLVSGGLWPMIHVHFDAGSTISVGQPTYNATPQEGYTEEMWPLVKWVLTLNTWLQQRLLVAPEVAPIRQYRKAMAREKHPLRPAVHIVDLRKVERPPSEPHEPASVDWSWRWTVRGHWRRQWHPSTKTHEVQWINPFLKGPDDRPLKPPAATIYEVRR